MTMMMNNNTQLVNISFNIGDVKVIESILVLFQASVIGPQVKPKPLVEMKWMTRWSFAKEHQGCDDDDE